MTETVIRAITVFGSILNFLTFTFLKEFGLEFKTLLE